MASFINTNMVSLNTQKNLTASQGALATSIQRLSSGMRINSAKDDAAGMAIANGMQATIKGQTVAMRNANDAISFSQTAEGALGKINDNLQRMRELAVQSANATNSADDRLALNTEFKELQAEITRVQDSAKFNGIDVLNKTATAITQEFQIGAGTSGYDKITTTSAAGDKTDAVTKTVTAAATATAAATTAVDITTAGNSTAAINAIDAALKENKTASIVEGATQNRFAAVISTLSVSVENQTQARSRIMDTDYAAETATLARGQILQQAGMAMLAQANQLPNGVMALMR
jgi:flagellin